MPNILMRLFRYWNRELEKLKKLEYTVGKDGQKVPLKGNARPRLYKALCGAFWLPYFIIGIYVFIQVKTISKKKHQMHNNIC